MKRKAVILLILILVFLSLTGMDVSAKSQYIPKFVSVVYDDSGSVHQNGSKNWAYANYAMQSFCGLLNKRDKLFVTYMSAPDKPLEMDLLTNKQQTIDGIRNHSNTQDTPFSVIDTAYNVFAGIPNSSKSTQYWLVIITDGKFITQLKTDTTEEILTSQNELSQKLNNMAQSKMPNGTSLKIMYLAIGTDAISPDPSQVKNLYLYPEYGSGTVFSGETIVEIMSTIADKVAGKTRLNPAQISFLDAKTVKVESKVKLVNIVVLSQKNSAKLLSAKIENGKELFPEQAFSIRYPQVTGRNTDESLNGSISLVGTDDENINAGTYILSFSEAVSADSFAVLFEPALEIRMALYYPDGREITDTDALMPGDTIHVKYKVFETGTDNEVPLDTLGTSAQYGLTYFEDGSKAGSAAEGQTTYEITLTQADTVISASILIEGFEPIISTIEFEPKKAKNYTVTATDYDHLTIGRRELIDNNTAIRFSISADGIKLTKLEIEALNIKFTINKHKSLLQVDTSVSDDGTVSCTPRFKSWNFPSKGFWNWTSTWLISLGEIKIIADIAGNELEAGKVTITSEGLPAIGINYLAVLFILFLFYGYIFKKRFRPGSKIYYIPFQNKRGVIVAQAADWQELKLSAATKWIVVPWFRNRMKKGGVTFYAVSKGAVGIMPKHTGGKTRRLEEDMVKENETLAIPVAAMGNPIVAADDAGRKKQDMIILMSGQSLLVSSDMESGIIYKLITRKNKTG